MRAGEGGSEKLEVAGTPEGLAAGAGFEGERSAQLLEDEDLSAATEGPL
ncbi:hypothetical protein BH18ACT10_BH18ACT10_13540 [soil metagenome]